MFKRFLLVLAMTALAASLGCSGTGPGRDTAAILDAGIDNGASLAPSGRYYTDLAGWEAWLADPGTPGVDYDPGRLTVSFIPGATLPKGVSALQPDAGARAEDQPNAIVRQNTSNHALTNAIAARYGLEIDKQVYWRGVNVASFWLPEGADGDAVLVRIRGEFAGAVEYAGYSQLYHAMDFTANDPDYVNSSSGQYGPLWTLHRIGCTDAWNLSRGSTWVRVAVADTGVRVTHEELELRVIDPQTDLPDLPANTYLDVVNRDNTMEDNVHHGTVIAGQIAAEGGNSRAIIGAAHGCEVLPVKISEAGLASDTDIITGCTLAMELDCQIVNLSFGDAHTNPSMEQMVNDIWSAGGIFVGAAGNDNVTTLTYPADYDNAISVGATDIDDARVEFSNYGPGVDIAAPGIGIKSTWHTGDSAYSEWTTTGGTSFACPLVAAAAALLWSYHPGLNNTNIRELLLSTAAPTTGFTEGTVGRLDIAAAMADVTPLSLELPRPSQLYHHGTIQVIPTVGGTPDELQCRVNGNLVETLNQEPWVFNVSTGSIDLGVAIIEVTAVLGQIIAVDEIRVLVDNTTGVFPLSEDFEGSGGNLVKYDMKGCNSVLLEAVKSIPGPGDFWTVDEVASAGSGHWFSEVEDVYEGSYGMYCGDSGRVYDDHEIDVLATRLIDLTGEASPTLVFHHHYNTSDGGNMDDLAAVYITNTAGRTFTPATLREGGDALFSGNSPDWSTVEIDLSEYAGELIHIVFAFETDKYSGGATAPLDDLGWWVDKIAIGRDYLESFPSFTGVSVEDGTVTGLVPGVETLPVALEGAQDIRDVTFAFDFAPIGEVDDYDIVVVDTVAPFETVLDVPTGMTNRRLVLEVTTTDTQGNEGPAESVPLLLFNLVGDVNLDGVVNEDDAAALNGLLGTVSGEPGYTVFIDANEDGLIDERDAAIIGYHYGESL